MYQSVVPWMHTGFSTVTEEVATRLHNEGHEVAIQSLTTVRKKKITWHGEGSSLELERPMEIYPSGSKFGLGEVKDNYDDFNADFLFTHFDSWMSQAKEVIPQLNIPYSSYVIVDHDPAPEAVIEQITQAYKTISMSNFGKHQLEQKGVDNRMIPHGIDTSEYYPLGDSDTPSQIENEDGDGNTRMIDVDDHFIFGIVAANVGSRKNIPNQLEAFKKFINRIDDSVLLYVHTAQETAQGYDLYRVQRELGIPDENVVWTREEDYGDVGNEYLNALYNSFDVLLNCSFGESWGLTVTEAQAAGTPVITTNFSSTPEQLGVNIPDKDNLEQLEMNNVYKAPHGIVCDPSTPFWKNKVDSRQYIVAPETIYGAMKYYYHNRDQLAKDGSNASKYVGNNYDWEQDVLPEFQDHFDEMEELVT
jgi:glycosyltransferase involved in cell wall biosynthesis